MKSSTVLIGMILILFSIFSCEESIENKSTPIQKVDTISEIKIDTVRMMQVRDSFRIGLANTINFLKDSVLKDKGKVISNYMNKYYNDTCGFIIYEKDDLKDFSEIKRIGDINKNNIPDSVFLMPPFNYCDVGHSFVFTDTTLPRLYTNTYCCSVDWIFSTDDIDEDGVREIGFYFSTGMSRYKCIRVYSLKNQEWKEIGLATFDIRTQDSEKIIFKNLVRKVKKNVFQIKTFIDGEKYWQTFEMK